VRHFYHRRGKRILDVAGASIGLLLSMPILGVAAVSVRTRMGSPVLFRQQRPGLNSRPFRLAKFRTMLDICDSVGHPRSDKERLTPLGRKLRSTSIDELPALWNVLRGDMSLVGPRPLLMEYLPLYSPDQARRHSVRPGISGWAQVNGRNSLSWEEKFDLDVWYVDHLSFALDMRIIWQTFTSVARRSGISAAGEATASPFRGDRD
jgi:lipopolysaccharide/colanic/teichoic acid biosynthesis glycosyltransferase